MKKLSILVAVLLLVTTLAGCGATTGGTTTTTTAGGTAATTTVGNTDATTTVGDTDATTTVGDTDGTTVDTPVSTTVGNTDGTTVVTPNTTVVTPNTTVVTPNTTVVIPVTTVKPTTVTTKVATTTTTKTVTTPTQNGLTTPPNGNYNLAWQQYPGSVYLNMDSAYDAKANALLATINGKADTLHASGTTYYISEKSGNDSNNGKSKTAAFKTVEPLRNASLKSGDVVLFERGGLYRVPEALKLVSGVSYGAYGSGTRPAIYGSSRNYAGVQWVNQGGNVWMIQTAFPKDVGVVVINHGELYGQWVGTKAELDKDMEFFCNRSTNALYLYSTIDPNTFQSVEIGHDGQLFNFDGLSNITIENLTFKYTGGHATRGSNTKNITIRGCEYGFIGGSVLSESSVNSPDATRYGNACEFMNNSENTLIENCWFYQIYDSSATCQGSGTSTGFTLRNCLSEYVGMGTYEYWGVTHKNTTIEGNVMRWAGYGHGGIKGTNGILRAHIQSNAKPGGSGGVLLQNFVVRNNVFDQSAYQLLNFCFSTNSTVTMSGNTYCQVKNNRRRPLGYFGSTTDTIYFDANIATTIKNVLKDATGVSAFA